MESVDGAGGEQSQPRRDAGHRSLSCFARSVTQVSIARRWARRSRSAAAAPDPLDPFRRPAGYIDRILRGEKPAADLPVQAPIKYASRRPVRRSPSAKSQIKSFAPLNGPDPTN